MDAEPAFAEAGCRIEGGSVFIDECGEHIEVLRCVACFVSLCEDMKHSSH
ncbi:hypothetical protein [Anaerosporobacter mobilis]|nr:hypothetical protein [Anaerosporobacter mobilis]